MEFRFSSAEPGYTYKALTKPHINLGLGSHAIWFNCYPSGQPVESYARPGTPLARGLGLVAYSVAVV